MSLLPEFVEKWGHLMAQNPAAFITLGFLAIMGTWLFAKLIYSGQIAILKEHVSLLERQVNHVPEGKIGTKPSLTADQYGQIVRYLKEQDPIYTTEDGRKQTRYIYVQTPANSDENEAIAFRLKNAIESAGWKATFDLRTPEERYSHGIWILGPDSEPERQTTSRVIIKAALASAGIQSNDEEEQGVGYHQPSLAFVILGTVEANS
jgi:hypothetical protein